MRVVAPLRPLRVVVVFRPVGLDHLVQLDERGGEGEVDDVGGHHVERELLPVGRPDPPGSLFSDVVRFLDSNFCA